MKVVLLKMSEESLNTNSGAKTYTRIHNLVYIEEALLAEVTVLQLEPK